MTDTYSIKQVKVVMLINFQESNFNCSREKPIKA